MGKIVERKGGEKAKIGENFTFFVFKKRLAERFERRERTRKKDVERLMGG
jgi:hypothetical protein